MRRASHATPSPPASPSAPTPPLPPSPSSYSPPLPPSLQHRSLLLRALPLPGLSNATNTVSARLACDGGAGALAQPPARERAFHLQRDQLVRSSAPLTQSSAPHSRPQLIHSPALRVDRLSPPFPFPLLYSPAPGDHLLSSALQGSPSSSFGRISSPAYYLVGSSDLLASLLRSYFLPALSALPPPLSC